MEESFKKINLLRCQFVNPFSWVNTPLSTRLNHAMIHRTLKTHLSCLQWRGPWDIPCKPSDLYSIIYTVCHLLAELKVNPSHLNGLSSLLNPQRALLSSLSSVFLTKHHSILVTANFGVLFNVSELSFLTGKSSEFKKRTCKQKYIHCIDHNRCSCIHYPEMSEG